MEEFIPCSLRMLPDEQQIEAAREAIVQNPVNAPAEPPELLPPPTRDGPDTETPQVFRLALLTSRWWGAGGVKLTVGFLDNAPPDLQRRILEHANAWGQWANVIFVLGGRDAQVRITRTRGQGYYSYLGVDCLGIPRDQPTMNLEAFSMQTPESEYKRVVRHEVGHTLGFPHEHMRQELVQRLDMQKTIHYFQQTQGWSAQQTQQQVLTPLEDRLLTTTPEADQTSIMCYQISGQCTIDGQPIVGGSDIDARDAEFVAKVYPPIATPPPPSARNQIVLAVDWSGKKVSVLSVN